MTTERFKTNGKVLEIARSFLGVVERPVNRTIFGEWFGWNGVAWCAIFQSYVHWHAGVPIPPIQTSKGGAYTPTYREHAIRTGQWRPINSGYHPVAGDLLLFQFTNRIDHIAVVQGRLPDGRDLTIEGNTNAAGSRTGGMVAQLNRRSSRVGYIQMDQPVVDWAAVRRWAAGMILPNAQKLPNMAPGGSPSLHVAVMQQALNVVSGAGLKEDGIYGPGTAQKVAAFQTFMNAITPGVHNDIKDPLGHFGDGTKWMLCVSLKNIADGRV